MPAKDLNRLNTGPACHLRRYHWRTELASKPSSGKAGNRITYPAYSSVYGFGTMPALDAFLRIRPRGCRTASSDLRMARTRPSTGSSPAVVTFQDPVFPGWVREERAFRRPKGDPSSLRTKPKLPVLARTVTWPPQEATWAMPLPVKQPRSPGTKSPAATGNLRKDSPVPSPLAPVIRKRSQTGDGRVTL